MPDQSVGGALRAQALRRPDRPFLTCGPDRFTFGELDSRTDRVAAGLSAFGIRPGDRVALLSPNRTEMAELYFALAKIGAVQVPLNAFLKGDFLRYQLADCAATVLIADSAGVAAALPLLDQLSELTGIVHLDEPDIELPRLRTVRYTDLRRTTTALDAVEVPATDLMSIVYTSGTTGFPKGCMLPHGYYLRCGQVMVDTVEMTDDDVLLTAMPLFHGACRMLVLAAGLIQGIEVCIEPEFRASTFLRRAVEVGATFALGVGAMGMALLGQPLSSIDREHRLRAFMLVPFPPDRQEQFRDRFGIDAWAEAYGQTECVPVTGNKLSGDRSAASCGRPAADLDVALLADDDTEVATGQIGEICVRPRTPFSMYTGYWGKPEATLKAFSSLWYHTGDFGRRDQDGFITFIDRKKDAVRRRGENVSTVELENAIAKHPDIAEVAVHAVPSAATEDDIKACLVLRPDVELDPAAFFPFLREQLPYFAVPRFVEILDELPKNAVGRVMKFQLRERPNTSDRVWDFEQLGLIVRREERR